MGHAVPRADLRSVRTRIVSASSFFFFSSFFSSASSSYMRLCTSRSARPSLSPLCRPSPLAARPLLRDYPSKQRLVRPSRRAFRIRSRGVGLAHEAPLRTSLGSTAFAATALFLSFGGSLYLYYHLQPSPAEPRENAAQPSLEAQSWIMVGETAEGRPGNLAPEQEAKLQEFWKATLKVFGVPLSDVAVLSDETNTALETEPAEELEEEVTDTKTGEKKKRRLGMFRRKKKDGKEGKESKDGKENQAPKEAKVEKSAASVHEAPKADADDKYGQTKEFHLALANNSPEDLRTAFWSMVKCDHPDSLLLRFLRARKWDIEKALVMMISTMHWRLNEVHVDDDIMKNGELASYNQGLSDNAQQKKEGSDFMAQLRLGKSFVHGLDGAGRPIVIVRVRLHRQGEQSEPSLERFTIHMIETARLLLEPPIDTATLIFDMTSFSLANMDYSPVKFMIKCFEANYPESLGHVLVHKAPWVFQGIWKIIRGWLDPVVAGKVHFTNDVKELEEYIPRSHIISEMGGDDAYTYKYLEPQPEENDAMKDEAKRTSLLEARAAVVKEFEDATKEWIRASASDGDGDGSLFREKRKAIAARLRTGYWELDPYLRARSLYDRLGVLSHGGRLDFYPEEKEAKAGTTEETKEAAVETEQPKDTGAQAEAKAEAQAEATEKKPLPDGPTPAGHVADGVD